MAETLSNPTAIIKAASACIWRGDKVLLVRRAKALGKGWWSLPGGKVEAGETARQAAVREAFEETGLSFLPVALIGEFEIKTPQFTYIIQSFTGPCEAGEARANSDVDAVLWIKPLAAPTLQLAPNTLAAIIQAQHLMRV